MNWRQWLVPSLAILSFVWCVAVGFVIWFTPLAGMESSGGSAQPETERRVQVPFSEVSEFGAAPLVVPAAIAAIGVWAAIRRRRILLSAAALLLATFTFLTGFSIGAAYIPASATLILAVAAAFAIDRRRGSRDD